MVSRGRTGRASALRRPLDGGQPSDAVERPSSTRIRYDSISASSETTPDRVVGQPCADWDAIIGQWTADVTAAQSAFDATESHWALPVYTPGG